MWKRKQASRSGNCTSALKQKVVGKVKYEGPNKFATFSFTSLLFITFVLP